MKPWLWIFGICLCFSGLMSNLWAQMPADSAVVLQNPADYYRGWVRLHEQEKILSGLSQLDFQIKEERVPGINYPEIRWQPLPPPPPFTVEAFQAWKGDDRYNFLYIFREVHWKTILPEYKTALDSLPTQQIRAKLQAQFGNPSVDVLNRFEKWGWKQEENVEFTYFLTVNDSIPLMISDINGPFEEGLVMVGNERDSTYFPLIKEVFSKRILDTNPVAYESFFRQTLDADNTRWVKATFDGETYRVVPVNSPLQKPPSNRREGNNHNNRSRNRRP